MDTRFIDFPEPNKFNNGEGTFMYSGFVRPGKHKCYLWDRRQDVWFYREIIVLPREKHLPVYRKVDEVKEEKIKVKQSVWKDWRVDN